MPFKWDNDDKYNIIAELLAQILALLITMKSQDLIKNCGFKPEQY